MASGDPPGPTAGAVQHGSNAVRWSIGTETDQSSGGGAPEMHYHFPVEIEVRNLVASVDQEALIHATLERLARELSA